MTANASAEADQFQRLMSMLARPTAFPPEGGAAPDAAIPIIQTHASAVLLTSERAYKVKKPVNLGFLDYTTVERRRRFCIEEYTSNQRLAPGVYLGIAPVLEFAGGEPRFGPALAPQQTPQAGERIEGGEVIDFAVVMRRLPEERTLASLVRGGQATPAMLRQLARQVADFHRDAQPTESSAAKTVDDMLANIFLTLRQSHDDIGPTISPTTYDSLQRYISKFTSQRRPLLESRARAGFSRDGHGDLRLEHVYALSAAASGAGNAGDTRYDLVIVDRIEFDPRFRIGDTASDIAFLIIELERVGCADLAAIFTEEYIERAGDAAALEVLPLYLVYRAMIRGHVRTLLLAEPGLAVSARASVQSEAEEMFRLAAFHATTPVEPMIVMIGGLVGSGKSTLAAALHEAQGWPILSSDQTRKRLAGLPLTAIPSAADQQRIYTAEWDERVYGRLLDEARALLAEGHSVILDATFARRERRAAVVNLARAAAAQAIFLECVVPREIALSRLAARWQSKRNLTSDDTLAIATPATLASDGRPELYDQLAQRWEAFEADRESEIAYARIDMSQRATRILEQALAALAIPRLMCKR